MLVLGIESSCDDTAAAVVQGAERRIISTVQYSQLKEHADYGGVVPEIGARAHAERLPGLVKAALTKAGVEITDLDGIAATVGPGLVGGLLVGSSFAKSVAMANQLPFIPVNHLEGHALSPQLAENGPDFPYLLLLISGGHCQYIQVNGLGDYTELGSTIDDAAGECFDKTAKLLGLPMPGGPELEKLAKEGDPEAFTLPFPLQDGSLNFSFSGLKTAVRNVAHAEAWQNQQAADLAASFQAQVTKILTEKTAAALAQTGARQFVIAGGVAANTTIRQSLEELCRQNGVNFTAPPLALCTDNAAMIAYAGALRLAAGQQSNLAAKVMPRWPLASLSQLP